MKNLKKFAAMGLVLALLSSCAPTFPEAASPPPADPSAASPTVPEKPVLSPTPDVVPEEPTPTLSPEELAVQEAEIALKSFDWPRETIRKTILGQDMEFFLYHGNGWTIHVPVHWKEYYSGSRWDAPSGHAYFTVSKQFLSVENPKWYRAQLGAWRCETDYAPPFNYYYEDDGGYTPPEGSADYIYFFAPDGDSRSYEFSLCTVVGRVSEEELAIQETMLLSFTLDESSHVLNAPDYTPGKTEWEAAMTALLAEGEPLMFFHSGTGTHDEADGKQTPDYATHALALRDFVPGTFTEMYFGNRPEGADVLGRGSITLYLPDLKLWLYCYDDSPWVHIHHAGEDYWAQVSHRDDPDKQIFDIALAWLEAEHAQTA